MKTCVHDKLLLIVFRRLVSAFFARDDSGHGTLYCRGTLKESADSVFLRLYAGETLLDTQHQKNEQDNNYALSVKLQTGLTAYRTEFGILRGGMDKILE